VSTLLNDARRLQTDLRKRAEKAIQDLEKRRARVLATFEEQATRVVESVVKRLNVATHAEIVELRGRIADLERRIESVAKERAA
jgi:polyhydroxyalkanoate synthesis regulator phasin